jgi:hypothetical protein
MVGAADCWAVQSKRQTIAPARTAWQAPTSTLGQARPSIGTSGGKGSGPLARPGASGANIAKPYKGPECSNGYRQRGRCDSRPDWHKLTVLISSAARHDPHCRGQCDHDPYRQGRPSRSVPASCDSAGLAQVQTYWWATDKPSLWMGRPPIGLAYMISPAYRSGLNDKFCLSVTIG